MGYARVGSQVDVRHVPRSDVELMLVSMNGSMLPLVKRVVARQDGWCLTVASDEAAALSIFASREPDVTVIEGGSEGLEPTGYELCRRFRGQSSRAGLILAVSRDTSVDTISGFDAGADDCITMSCDAGELTARMKALVRRLGDSNGDLDLRLKAVSGKYQLSGREKAVLAELVRGVHSKEVACRIGCEYSTVRTHVRRIARKLGCSGLREVLLTFYRSAPVDI